MAILKPLVILVCLTPSCLGNIADLYGDKTAKEEYDYIVVGSGSSGSVVANRLSEDGKSTVLLLEAGGPPPGITEVPLFAIGAVGNEATDWQYFTEKQKDSCRGITGQRSFWARGKMLGGCSSHNFMQYVRGNKKDYDNWAQNYGATGWSWNELLPYFMASEAVKDPTLLKTGFHGTDGHLTVTPLAYRTPLVDAYLNGARSLGFKTKMEYNDGEPIGFSPFQVSQRDGLRCSVEKAFLRSALDRPNLDILPFAHATQVVFDDKKRATGVTFVQTEKQSRETKQVKATKEIILSGGAIGSPHILLLSGIGPKSHLDQMGIPVVSDLPVGRNLHDHVASGGLYYVLNDSVAIVNSRDVNRGNVGLLQGGKGPLTSPTAFEVVGFVNTKYQKASEKWPDMELMFASSLGIPANTLNKSILAAVNKYKDKDVVSIVSFLARPKSRGYLKLRSKDPFEHPIIDPRFFLVKDDLARLVQGMKIADRVMRSPPLQRYGAKRFPDVVQGCEGINTKSDDYLKCLAQTLTLTIYHPCGSCKMGDPADSTTVVDPQLRVKGVTGLRVADASIMPTIVSGNTNAPCIMIGEKAADMIRNGK